jgi:glycosyltransferase involved in cell wall biosynthesis
VSAHAGNFGGSPDTRKRMPANGPRRSQWPEKFAYTLDWVTLLATSLSRMKVLIDCHVPFSLAHGGMQTQIEQTRARLRELGVDADYLHWWDETQRPDVIHFFGVPSGNYAVHARTKGVRFLLNNLFTATCNRSDLALTLQSAVTRLVQSLPLLAPPAWKTYREADHHVVSLQAEKEVLERVYGVPGDRVSCVPYGLSDAFLKAGPGDRSEPHLICTGTITGRKRMVELARLAHRVKVPILFVGKPYSETEPYWKTFQSLVDGQQVKHLPHTGSESHMVQLLQRSRGFVLMNRFENWCLSAHEAAACGLPLLLPDQKWVRERFGSQVRRFAGQPDRDAGILKEFYDECPKLAAPKVRLYSWLEVAQNLKSVYEQLLKTSR